jgi:predicted tellurium resistance membrane protein TerC
MFFGLAEGSNPDTKGKSLQKSFWTIVLVVEMTDIVFSIDSITTAVAFSNKVWVLWFGGIAGIVLMRFLSGFFVKAIERVPKLEDLAYQLVFFVGTKLSLETLGVEIERSVFWLMMGVIGVIGASLIVREDKLHKHSRKKAEEIIGRLKRGEISVQEALEKHQEDGRVLSYLYREGVLKASIE